MANLHPFKALRPRPELAEKVATLPYDVMNRSEAKEMARTSHWSFLRVTRSEIDLPDDVSSYADIVYKKAIENLNQMIEEEVLVQEEEPKLYLYRLKMGAHEQTGVVGCFSVDEYDHHLIKRHERTRREKEDDRTKHIQSVMAQTGPVFLTYSFKNNVQVEVDTWKKKAPLFDFKSEDGVHHTVWIVDEPAKLVEIFRKQVNCLYIADGHHRAASASRVRSEVRSVESQTFLAVAFPDSELQVLPYHRVIKNFGGLSDEGFLEHLKERFELEKGNSAIPPQGKVGMYFQKKWHLLTLKPGKNAYRLDVDMLQEELLAPVFKIIDPREDKRIDFVGGIRGTVELERLVNSGDAKIAFSMHPTPVGEVMRIADEGGIMPPKSTWFEPKLRDGLLIHSLT